MIFSGWMDWVVLTLLLQEFIPMIWVDKIQETL